MDSFKNDLSQILSLSFSTFVLALLDDLERRPYFTLVKVLIVYEPCANINSQHLHNLHILFLLYIFISILLLAMLLWKQGYFLAR